MSNELRRMVEEEALRALHTNKIIHVMHTRFRDKRGYDGPHTRIALSAAALAVTAFTKDELLSDPSGTAVERLIEIFGGNDARVEGLLRALKEREDNPPLAFTTTAALEAVDVLFNALTPANVPEESDTSAPTIVLACPADVLDDAGPFKSVAGVRYAVRRAWEFMATKWYPHHYKHATPDYVIEFDFRYTKPDGERGGEIEFWLRAVREAKLKRSRHAERLLQHAHRWKTPGVDEQLPAQKEQEETKDEDDEDDDKPEASVVPAALAIAAADASGSAPAHDSKSE